MLSSSSRKPSKQDSKSSSVVVVGLTVVAAAKVGILGNKERESDQISKIKQAKSSGDEEEEKQRNIFSVP